MRLQKPAAWTARLLVLLGAVCVWMRLKAGQNAFLDYGGTAWRLSYDIAFRAAKSGAGVRAALPYNTARSRVLRETFSYPGSSMYVVRSDQTGGREAITVALSPSKRSRFLAQFDIQVSPRGKLSPDSFREDLSETARTHYLRHEQYIQTASPPVTELLSVLAANKASGSELLDRIFRYCSEEIAPGSDSGPSDAAGTLKNGAPATLGRARAMVALCRASGLPARLVTGFVLGEDLEARPHTWVDVHVGGQWVPYDPENGYSAELPATYLPVQRDEVEIVKAFENEAFHPKFSIHRLRHARAAGLQESRLLEVLDLTRLDPGMQRTLSLLLLLPAGALVTAIFRNFIGVQTFGTFAPALLAMSFVHADWRTGVVILIMVMAVGLAGRVLLNHLKLVMVPRLGIVVTLVVLSLAMVVSVLDYFRLTPASEAVLLPMVITTMTIERFHICSEEEGLFCAVKILAETLLVALCCFLVLRLETLGRLMLSYPEGEFFVIAALIGVGRYAGYRLTELWRFRDMGRLQPPEETK